METRAFVTALIRDNMPAAVIVDTDFLFANDRLARHYSLEPLSGHAVRKVPVPPGSPIGGLLTQAAIQKVTANGTNTSPVVRGAWVMTRLLGQPPPPARPATISPSASAGELEESQLSPRKLIKSLTAAGLTLEASLVEVRPRRLPGEAEQRWPNPPRVS
jgi:hypothetical protein